MRKRKILFLTRPISPPWDEGAKNFVYRLINHLHLPNDEIYVITSSLNTPRFPPYIKQILLKFHPKGTVNLKWKIQLACLFLSTKADVVHCFFSSTFLTSLIIKIIKLLKKYKVIQTTTSLKLRNKLLIKLAMYGDHIICFSQATVSLLTSAGIKNVHLIPPGVNLETFRPQKKKKAIAIMGELYRLRSFNLVTTLIPKILANFPDHQLLAAFRVTNKYRKEETALINQLKNRFGQEKRITFQFSKHIGNMPQFLGPVKLVFYPAIYTKGKFDLPLVSIESLACGTPVIFSPISPYTEIKKYPGFFTPQKNTAQAFVKKAKEVLDVNFKKASKETRKTAEKYFDIKKIAREYEALYEKL